MSQKIPRSSSRSCRDSSQGSASRSKNYPTSTSVLLSIWRSQRRIPIRCASLQLCTPTKWCTCVWIRTTPGVPTSVPTQSQKVEQLLSDRMLSKSDPRLSMYHSQSRRILRGVPPQLKKGISCKQPLHNLLHPLRLQRRNPLNPLNPQLLLLSLLYNRRLSLLLRQLLLFSPQQQIGRAHV